MDNLVERWGELEVIEGKTFDNNTSWIPKYSQHYKDCIFTKLELVKFSYNGLVIENCAFQNCKIQDFFWTESDILRTKFVSCSISFGHFGDVLFEKVEFIGCWEILEVRFGGCEINEVSFTDCDFSYSRIEPIIGKGKMHFKFDKTKLYYSFFKNVDLTRSSISDCSMIQTTFSNCRLKNELPPKRRAKKVRN